jgi:prepilin-type N-terminal cleavage/methylation domain-containing protein
MLTPRGVTLVELLVTLGLMGIVSTAIYRVLVNSQRAYQVETQRIDMQQNLRAAATILPAELRELDAADGDLIALSSTSLTIRATRQLAFICALPAIGVPVAGTVDATLTIRQDPFYGMRDLSSTTDSIFVFYEGDPGTPRDDGWVRGRLSADPAPLSCADGSPGRLLRTRLVFQTNQVARTGSISSGSPVRGFETMSYALYLATDNRWYLGAQSGSSGGMRQPVVGPLSGATGVTFEYFDADGATTAVATQVALIRITVRARTAVPVRKGDGPPAYVTDSITTTVSLRNNRRWDTTAPGS